MEIVLLLSIGFLSGVALTWLFELVLKTNKKLRHKYYMHHQIFWHRHVHHSTYGLVAVILSAILFFTNQKTSAIFWFSMGVGIITEHTLSDGRFIFIEKEKS